MIKYLSLFLAMSNLLSGQNDCGQKALVYKDYNGFTTAKAIDSLCVDDHNTIKFNGVNLILTQHDGSRKYKNGSVWGFSRGDALFRYIDQKKPAGYRWFAAVLNDKGLVLYSNTEPDVTGLSLKIEYFYSLGLDGDVRNLTMKNLESDFAGTGFLKQVKSLDRLYEQDRNGHYVICRLFERYGPRSAN
jgi:hypothetical protein